MNPIQKQALSFFLFSVTFFTSVTRAVEEQDSDLELYKRLYDFGLGKRAYSYVSEYKRLPVYNFGLGKRAKQYNFGLGKRDNFATSEHEDDLLNYDYTDRLPEEEIYDDDEMQHVDKRSRSYSFGLGKRKPKYEFGLGKRLPKYDFGLGKRAPSKFNFGLGKRERLYNFGLGKRPNVQSRFNFGLGKRSEEDEKRAVPSQRYSFGIGKRDINNNNVDYTLQDSELVESDVQNSTDSEQHQLEKRRIRNFDFGLGKRASDAYYENLYTTALKRIPKYDFGLGK